MRTIGEVLSQARKRKKISIRRLSQITKIKEEFLQAIESGDWQRLSEFTVTAGFVRNFAQNVGIDPKIALAILRRDFPKESKVAKPFEMSLSAPTFWTPRTTLFVAISLVTLALSFYLIRQYLTFVAAPQLGILAPSQNQEFEEREVEVLGKTSPQASVRVNNQPVLVDEKGFFKTKIVVSSGIQNITIQSQSRSGKKTEKIITVKVK